MEDSKQIGNVFESGNRKNPNQGRVYDTNYVAPTLNCMGGGGLQPMVVDKKNIPCKLNKMPNGELTSMDEAELCDIGTETASTVTSRYYKGIGSHKDNMVIENSKYFPCALRGRSYRGDVGQNLELNGTDCSNAITSASKDAMVVEMLKALGVPDHLHDYCYLINGELYLIRIRKLTPRECLRLMDVEEKDIDAITSTVSNTQAYKQSGNSIVVNVMCEMFKRLNIRQESAENGS